MCVVGLLGIGLVRGWPLIEEVRGRKEEAYSVGRADVEPEDGKRHN
jgi:hypothetical protein